MLPLHKTHWAALLHFKQIFIEESKGKQDHQSVLTEHNLVYCGSAKQPQNTESVSISTCYSFLKTAPNCYWMLLFKHQKHESISKWACLEIWSLFVTSWLCQHLNLKIMLQVRSRGTESFLRVFPFSSSAQNFAAAHCLFKIIIKRENWKLNITGCRRKI